MAANGFPPHERGSPKRLHDSNNSLVAIERPQTEDMRLGGIEDMKDNKAEHAAEQAAWCLARAVPEPRVLEAEQVAVQEAAAAEQEADRRAVEVLPETPLYDNLMSFVPEPIMEWVTFSENRHLRISPARIA
jgi:hypothetical protein